MAKSNKRDAGGPLAGFIYQLYYYLERLLLLGPGEAASLEVFDDVAVEKDGQMRYFQLKHTSTANKTTSVRMCDRDRDLWKTLSSWVEIINEKSTEHDQLEWINEAEFELLTNKDVTDNKLYELLTNYHKCSNSDEVWNELFDYIKKQSKTNSSKEDSKNDVDRYAKRLCDFKFVKEFLLKVKICTKSDNDILESVQYVLINQKHVTRNNAKYLREILYGRLLTSVNNSISEDGKSRYTDEEFNNDYGTDIDSFKNRKFIYTNSPVELPEKLEDQVFLRQLLDIGDAKAKGQKRMLALTTDKLRFENDYNASKGNVSSDDIKAFEYEVHNLWDTIFNAKSNSDKDPNVVACEVLNETRSIGLLFAEEHLRNANGCYYHFSDGEHPTIGWHKDWMNKYNGIDWLDKYGS